MLDSVIADRSSASSAEEAQSALARVADGDLGPVHWLWVATIAVVVGDLVTTLYGLSVGLSEQNPVVAAVLVEYGVLGMVGLKLFAVGWVLAIWWALGRIYGVAALLGLFLPQAAAVVLNVLTIYGA